MTKSPKTTTAPTGQIAPFGLRMLPELREKVEQAARESGRSMNAEIVARLEGSFASATVEKSGALTALALRLAQAELQLAEAQLEAEELAVEANIAAGTALLAAKFNSENKYPQPITNDDFNEMRALYEETCARIDEVDEKKYKELNARAEAALDRLAKLKASSLSPSPRHFRSARLSSKKI